MNMTKRDVGDIVLVWMAITFLLHLGVAITSLGFMVGMNDKATEFTEKSAAIAFQILCILFLGCLNYVLLFRRSLVLSLVFPDGDGKELQVPDGLTALVTYSFWVKLTGIFTFLTSSIALVSRLATDLATRSMFVGGASYYLAQSGFHLLSAVLALVMVWKADWISATLEKFGRRGRTGRELHDGPIT